MTAAAASPRRPWRRVLVTLLLGWLLAWAALVVVAWWVLPRIDWDAGRVGRWLSDRAGLPLQVEAVDARWSGRGPVLRLHGLALGEGGQVRVGSAQLRLAVYDGLLPGRSLGELHITGLDLRLRRDDDGRWQVLGLPAARGGSDPLDALSRLGEIQISGSRLHLDAPGLGLDRHVPRVDLRLRVDGNRLRAGLRGWVHDGEAPVRASVDLARDTGSGRVWLGSEALSLANWPAPWRVEGARLEGGTARASLWLEVDHWQLQRVRARARADALLLRGADDRHLALGRTELLGQWQRQAEGWQVWLPRLRLDGQEMDGVWLDWGRTARLQARHLDLGPLLKLLALGERVPAPTRQWLHAAAPGLVLEQVDWEGTPGQAWQGTARLRDLAFRPVGNAPGLAGLGGRLEADERGVVLRLDARREVVLDWPGGFGEPHRLHLQGGLGAWPEAGGWRIGVDHLRVKGTDYGAWVRGGLLFQPDGGRPRLDLAASLDDAPMTVARRFWIRSKMSPAAIAWLDAALVAGQLRGGQGLVSGDLDHWPFADGEGRFEARGRIDRGTVHFADGWQPLTGVMADLAFIGPGFEMGGSGQLGGAPVTAFTAGIARFSDPLLRVQAEGRGDAARYLRMLAGSPLREGREDLFGAVALQGPARVRFSLEQKLGEGAYSRVGGQAELQGVHLADSRWNLQFERMRGIVRYDGNGFAAPALQGRLDGQPARLALRAGSGHVQRPGNAFEAELATQQDIRTLLARAPDVAWLGRYLQGRSHWDIGLDVPAGSVPRGSPSAVLSLRSDLAGTALGFPAPLDKAADLALPARVRVPLPAGTAPVEVGLGSRLGLLVDTRGTPAAVLATLGGSQPRGALPVRGLRLNGQADRFDALGWVNLAGGSGSGSAGTGTAPLVLQSVDLQVDDLRLAGGRFPATRLRVDPGNARTRVLLEGPALSGQLTIPDARGATVVGKLQTLHWQPVAAGSPGTADAVDGSLANPASIPPLALEVERMQVGQVVLGSALLRSRPLPDGIQVDVLQLRSPGQVIDLQGSWRGTGERARTSLQVSADSQDIAALGQLLGQGGHLRGGQGTLRAEASWPGSPQDFAVAGLSGQVRLEARNGQLLEVEPGAGRVLGLFSLGQLPRRMMLDFRDLFARGLAYNQIQGEIRFGNGRATTCGIRIDGPAAQIQISGQADLVGQRFDQTVEVNPRSGNLLTVVGAVAGGPVGAAVGAAANAVLARPLGEIGARTYHVTGPWKEPKVEVIDRPPARRPAPAPASAVPGPAPGSGTDPSGGHPQ